VATVIVYQIFKYMASKKRVGQKSVIR